MEGRSIRGGEVKQILNAGLALALSAGRSDGARVLSRNHHVRKASFLEAESSKGYKENHEEQISLSSLPREIIDGEKMTGGHRSSAVEARAEKIRGWVSEDDALSIVRRIGEIRNRVCELEDMFIQFCVLKEQESWLVEQEMILAAEKSRIEVLSDEMSWIETEMKTILDLEKISKGAMDAAELLIVENGLLRRKTENPSWEMNSQSRKIPSRSLRIKHLKATAIRRHTNIKGQENMIRAIQNENRGLRETEARLKSEKSELLGRLESIGRGPASVSLLQRSEIVGKKMMRLKQADELREFIALRRSDIHLGHIPDDNQTHSVSSFHMKAQLEIYLNPKKESENYGATEVLEIPAPRNHVAVNSRGKTTGSRKKKKKNKFFATVAKWVSRSGTDSKSKRKNEGKEE